MPNILDVFSGDAFNAINMTLAINKLPVVPGRIGSMGLFTEQGVSTTVVVLEERDGIIALVPTQPRGGPTNYGRGEKRKARSFQVPHIPLDDAILANDIQNVRKFGSNDELEGIYSAVNDKLMALKRSLDATVEYHMAGALQGNILDADGSSVIYNLFTVFDLTETEVDFILNDSNTNVGQKCIDVKREIESALGGTPMSGVHALCGKDWWDAFVAHDDVKDAWARYQDGAFFRVDNRAGFEYKGILFEEYNYSVGDITYIPTDEARFFPEGVPGLFMRFNAPGDFIEAANTIGLPYYAKQEIMKFGRGVEITTEVNPLCICTRPQCLVKGVLDDTTQSVSE